MLSHIEVFAISPFRWYRWEKRLNLFFYYMLSHIEVFAISQFRWYRWEKRLYLLF